MSNSQYQRLSTVIGSNMILVYWLILVLFLVYIPFVIAENNMNRESSHNPVSPLSSPERETPAKSNPGISSDVTRLSSVEQKAVSVALSLKPDLGDGVDPGEDSQRVILSEIRNKCEQGQLLDSPDQMLYNYDRAILSGAQVLCPGHPDMTLVVKKLQESR